MNEGVRTTAYGRRERALGPGQAQGAFNLSLLILSNAIACVEIFIAIYIPHFTVAPRIGSVLPQTK
jgi:hypothetical protein